MFLVIRARGPNPADRFDINPVKLPEEMVTTVCGGLVRVAATKPKLRVGNNTTEALRLDDVAFKCLKADQGCQASLRICHWAPFPQRTGHAAAASDNAGMVFDGNFSRKCWGCGKRGHRVTTCCDKPGNCRVEFIWSHSYEMKSNPISNTEAKPVKNRARMCPYAKIAQDIRDSSRRLEEARSSLLSLRATVASLEDIRSRIPQPADLNGSVLRTTMGNPSSPGSLVNRHLQPTLVPCLRECRTKTAVLR